MDNVTNKIWNSVKTMGLTSFRTSIDSTRSILDYNDKFIVWIVGFAVTSITLVVANSEKLLKIIDTKYLNWIIIFLSVSLVLGIFYRLLSFVLLRYLSDIIVFFEVALSTNYDIPPMEDYDIERVNKSSDFNYVISEVGHSGGNIPNLESLIASYNNGNNAEKEVILSSVKSFYKDCIDFNKKHYDLAMEHLIDTYKKGLGITDNEINNIMNNNDSVTGKYYRLISVHLMPYSFILSCLSFLVAIGIIISSYLIK